MYYFSQKSELRKAILFGTGLMISLLFFIIIAVNSAGPIVLGTELNTNGSVEYLCLGNGCNNFRAMDF